MEIKHSKGKFYTKTKCGRAELLYHNLGKNTVSIYHTFVPDACRGKGIAEKLAEHAFEFAGKEKLKVRPDCPYIIHFLEKRPEFRKYSI